MRIKFNRVWSGAAALAVAASAAPFLSAPAAHAAGTLAGAATVRNAGNTANLYSGTSATQFTLSLPAGASCPGDSTNSGYAVQSYMVPSSVNPATLTFDSSGPIGQGTGAAFKQPLYQASNTSPYAAASTADQTTAGGPGQIINIPAFTYGVFLPGDVPAGLYNLGIACTKGVAGPTQMSSYWNVQKTFATDAASGGPAQVDWAVGIVANAPVLNTVTPASGSLTAAFTPAAVIAGNAPDTNYTVTAVGPTTVTQTGTASPITVSGLTNGSVYSVAVKTNNPVGASAASNAISGTPAIPPNPGVASFSATPGPNRVDLAWTAPASGPAVTGYTITYTPNNGSPASPINVSAATFAQRITSLTAGTAYSFTITPQQASGTPSGTTSAATPTSAAIVIQDVTVNRPAGTLVLTQVCGKNAQINADTLNSPGFPVGSPLTALIPAAGPGTAPTLTAGGAQISAGEYAGYPYPTDANGVSTVTYNTHCGINLGKAQFVKTGAGAGQFFAAGGVLNQVTVVDTRDTDIGWGVTGTMGTFSAGAGKAFSGSQLGWTPQGDGGTAMLTDSDGNTYKQTTAGGAVVPANSLNAVGLSTGRSLGIGQAVNCTAGPPKVCTGGLGIASFDARLKLLIPVTAVSGDYTGTLTLNVV